MNKISVYRPIFIYANFISRVISGSLYQIFHFRKFILHNDTNKKFDYSIDQ